MEERIESKESIPMKGKDLVIISDFQITYTFLQWLVINCYLTYFGFPGDNRDMEYFLSR